MPRRFPSSPSHGLLAPHCWIILSVIAILLVGSSGCSNRPRRLKAPKVDPNTAAAAAISMYDANGDGNLSGDELTACPGIKATLSLYDTDSNQIVSREEIVNRLQHLIQAKIGLTSLRVSVSLNGAPLAGAQVKFAPESYLGDQIKPAVGTTNRAGTTSVSVKKEDLPAAQRAYHGIQFGTYKVEITHPETKIPAKYNTETTLGYETIIGNPQVEFDLSD